MQAILRVVKSVERQGRPKKYKGSYATVNEYDGKVLARCDLVGQATFAGLDIRDISDDIWRMRPNRKIISARWICFWKS